MQPIELCKHTTRTSAMLIAATPGENLIDFGVRRLPPLCYNEKMKTKSSRFDSDRNNKATAGRRTPKLVLFLLLPLAASCHRPPPASQNAQATPSPSASVSSQSFPQRVGLVNDFANAFNASQKKN